MDCFGTCFTHAQTSDVKPPCKHPRSPLQRWRLQAPFKPPFSTLQRWRLQAPLKPFLSPLEGQAPFKPSSSPLEAPFKPPRSPPSPSALQAPLKPPSSPLEAFRRWSPLRPSDLRPPPPPPLAPRPFKPPWRGLLKGVPRNQPLMFSSCFLFKWQCETWDVAATSDSAQDILARRSEDSIESARDCQKRGPARRWQPAQIQERLQRRVRREGSRKEMFMFFHNAKRRPYGRSAIIFDDIDRQSKSLFTSTFKSLGGVSSHFFFDPVLRFN